MELSELSHLVGEDALQEERGCHRSLLCRCQRIAWPEIRLQTESFNLKPKESPAKEIAILDDIICEEAKTMFGDEVAMYLKSRADH
jgi:hypothetical protein